MRRREHLRVAAPIQAVCEGESFLLVGEAEYQSESGWPSLGVGCLAWIALEGAAFVAVVGLDMLVPDGWLDLVMVFAPLLLALLIGTGVLAWNRGRRWWSTAELEIGAEGLTHRDWTLPWSRIQRVAGDRVGWAQLPGGQPVLVVVESPDLAWAFPTQDIDQAERFAEVLEAWRPRVAQTPPTTERAASERRHREVE